MSRKQSKRARFYAALRRKRFIWKIHISIALEIEEALRQN